MHIDLEAERAKSIARRKDLLLRAATNAVDEKLPPEVRQKWRDFANRVNRDLLRLKGVPVPPEQDEVDPPADANPPGFGPAADASR